MLIVSLFFVFFAAMVLLLVGAAFVLRWCCSLAFDNIYITGFSHVKLAEVLRAIR